MKTRKTLDGFLTHNKINNTIHDIKLYFEQNNVNTLKEAYYATSITDIPKFANDFEKFTNTTDNSTFEHKPESFYKNPDRTFKSLPHVIGDDLSNIDVKNLVSMQNI